MKINWNGNLPVSAAGGGCVIDAPGRGGFGFHRLRSAGKSIIIKAGVTLGAVSLAGLATLGMIELGYEAHTAAAATAAAGKVGVATAAALIVAGRRKKRKAKTTITQAATAQAHAAEPEPVHPVSAEPQHHIPPSATAPADDQPGRAN
ncbi:hypothetical protein [Streptomyces subrutilus]|uniref:hypothetical protein n=1 Tax=Streptomyces subrutilus TaxID=36818 RepID=UPI0033FFE716